MSIRRSNQLSYTPKNRKVNKGNRKAAGKPSVHIPQVTRGAILEGLGDNRPKSLRGKGVIGQFFQGNPLETNLPTIGSQTTTDGRKITTRTVKDGFDLMEASMDTVHAMVLANILAEVDQATGNDLQAQFLKNFALDGIGQRFAMLLTAARQHEKFTFIGPYPDH